VLLDVVRALEAHAATRTVFKDLVLGRIKLVELRVRYALSFVATLEKTRRGKLRKESPLGRGKRLRLVISPPLGE